MNEWFLNLQAWLLPVTRPIVALLPPESPLTQLTVAGCTLALVLILCRTPSRFAAIRQTYVLIMGLAALAFLIGLTGMLPDSVWLQAVIWLPGLLLAGALVGKLMLANRFAALRDARHDRRSRVDSNPLPFQQRALDQLREQATLSPTPLTLGLQAKWGAGKSIVMEHLLKNLDDGLDRFVAIKLNVWEYEDYDDLQFGAMQALLAHPRVLERYGWVDFPLWMLAREWGGLSFRRIQFGWGQSQADADGKLHLPWQGRFERIVARQHLVGRRVVFVLDESERASAPATQGALTLIARSLSLPGVVAVVPFVEDVIRFKAFHPDMVVLEDLRDTIAGHFHTEWLHRHIGASGENPVCLDSRKTCARDRLATFANLASEFMKSADSLAWSDYYGQMTEKYLRHQVFLGRPDGRDLLAFLRLPEVKAMFAGLGEARYQSLLEWVEEMAEKGFPPFRKIETQIRWLKGDLLKVLSVPVDDKVDPRFCLMLALAMGR